MPCATHRIISLPADRIAAHAKELSEQRDDIGLSMRRDEIDELAGNPVVGDVTQRRWPGVLWRRRYPASVTVVTVAVSAAFAAGCMFNWRRGDFRILLLRKSSIWSVMKSPCY